LAQQVATLRQKQIDPSANDPLVQQAQQELNQLMTQKAAADAEVNAAENFASDELAGIRGNPRNSGQAGNGPRRRAAMERLTNAKNHVQQIEKALDAARTRLDNLRRRSKNTVQPRTEDQLPGFQEALASESSKLADAKSELARLTSGRADAIRRHIDNAPDHVIPDDGFLAQIRALEQIAEADTKIMMVIFLIDFTSFGFELASVLAKVTSFVPTTYAALLARDAYLSSVRIADTIHSELSDLDSDGPPEPEIFPPETPGPPPGGPIFPSDPFGSVGLAQKRPRGRPRKTTLN
jgi:hypothetical protein